MGFLRHISRSLAVIGLAYNQLLFIWLIVRERRDGRMSNIMTVSTCKNISNKSSCLCMFWVEAWGKEKDILSICQSHCLFPPHFHIFFTQETNACVKKAFVFCSARVEKHYIVPFIITLSKRAQTVFNLQRLLEMYKHIHYFCAHFNNLLSPLFIFLAKYEDMADSAGLLHRTVHSHTNWTLMFISSLTVCVCVVCISHDPD